jgi:hypothetical protein
VFKTALNGSVICVFLFYFEIPGNIMEPDAISEQNEQRDISDRLDRKRFTRKKLYLLLIPAFIILTMLLFFLADIFHTPDLNELLARAKLAKFPQNDKESPG